MKRRWIRWSFAIVGAIALVAIALVTIGQRPVPDASADSLKNSNVSLVRVFENISLTQPVWFEQEPGGKWWYAVEQPGRLVAIPVKGSPERNVALDITDRVKSGGERGLLGLAFHPDYEANGHIFVNYTANQDGNLVTRVSRFTSRPDGVSFDPGSEKILLRVTQPYGNHNGGQVSFGPDGFLYIGYGDGGLAGDPKEHGQNVSTLLGTIARIDVDGGDPYAVPPDNPFAKKKGGAPEVYAWGLRNPWRFSFDSKTGKLWAGDVGQNAWEEISVVEKGKNYGWNIREGTHCYDPPMHLKPLGKGDCGREGLDLEPPVLDYSQDEGDRSVTGGYVYRGTQSPGLVGKYIYGDFVSGRIWAYDPKTKTNVLLIDTPLAISSFAQGPDGEIGVLDYSGGAVYHLTER